LTTLGPLKISGQLVSSSLQNSHLPLLLCSFSTPGKSAAVKPPTYVRLLFGTENTQGIVLYWFDTKLHAFNLLIAIQHAHHHQHLPNLVELIYLDKFSTGLQVPRLIRHVFYNSMTPTISFAPSVLFFNIRKLLPAILLPSLPSHLAPGFLLAILNQVPLWASH